MFGRLGARILLSAALGLIPLSAQADRFMNLRNEAALARGFGLPALGRAHLAEGDAWILSADLSNEYHASQDGGSALLLDGETARYAITYRRRIGARLELGVELPLLHQSGGFMDSGIENWHDWFSLPNGGRNEAEQDQYRYRYVESGEILLDVTDRGTRLGEARLLAAWALGADTALRGAIKLPTGDADRLSGNDALAVSAWLDHGWQRGAWSAYLSGGGLYAAQGEVLREHQRRWVALGGAGLGWQAWPALRFLVQLNAHSALYENVEDDILRRAGLQLGIGAAIRLSPVSEFQIGFQEDPIVASSPDFSLHFALAFE